jgi:hypothetical protein
VQRHVAQKKKNQKKKKKKATKKNRQKSRNVLPTHINEWPASFEAIESENLKNHIHSVILRLPMFCKAPTHKGKKKKKVFLVQK